MSTSTMTVAAIKDALAAIQAAAEDEDVPYEEPHILEDQLLEVVLAAIAQGSPDAQELAQAVLKVKTIEYDKCYS